MAPGSVFLVTVRSSAGTEAVFGCGDSRVECRADRASTHHSPAAGGSGGFQGAWWEQDVHGSVPGLHCAGCHMGQRFTLNGHLGAHAIQVADSWWTAAPWNSRGLWERLCD